MTARRQAITEVIDKLKAARPAGDHPDEILGLLEVVPDLRPALKEGDPEKLAEIFRDFWAGAAARRLPDGPLAESGTNPSISGQER